MIDFNVRDYLTGELPPGKYTFLIKDVTLKENKNNEGKHLSLNLEVVSAFRRGAKMHDNLNIYNNNEVAQKIARERLAQLFKVLDMLDNKDTHQLIGKIVDGEVSEYKGSANIKNYYEATGKNQYEALTAAAPQFDDEVPF